MVFWYRYSFHWSFFHYSNTPLLQYSAM